MNDEEIKILYIPKNMKSKVAEKERQEIEIVKLSNYNLYKIVDKLEQRIATLEKVLASHAKCIGEMREDKNE